MGRTRRFVASPEDLFNQRSRRTKSTLSIDKLHGEATGQATSEERLALYHCNYCNVDITEKFRIKCAQCPNFDLCLDCFSVGAEVMPHKSNHAYRVMENLSFPLLSPDWCADEEILLLEGIEMYGLSNWTEVSGHVATKSKAQCIDHYTNAYLNSPCFPRPDMSYVVGKDKQELLAMGKEDEEGKKEYATLIELSLKEESRSSTSSVKIEESWASTLTKDSMVGSSSTVTAAAGAVKKAAEMSQVKEGHNAIQMEDRTIGVKKLKSSDEKEMSMINLRGYNPKRQEFDPDFDNEAEKTLADMEFKDTDTEAEREEKLQILHTYSRRLDERKRRKEFIFERNLLSPDLLVKDLSLEEREIYHGLKVFARFHSKEEHENMLKILIQKHRIQKKIRDIQEAREAGCRTASELDRYIGQKRKEAEESAHKAKISNQVGRPRRMNRLKGGHDTNPCSVRGSAAFESSGMDASSTSAGPALCSLDDWDVTGLPGADLLSSAEQQLCNEMKILPSMYLMMLEVMSSKILEGKITKKSDAHGFFKVDPSKVDRVYDVLVAYGIAPP